MQRRIRARKEGHFSQRVGTEKGLLEKEALLCRGKKEKLVNDPLLVRGARGEEIGVLEGGEERAFNPPEKRPGRKPL